MIDPKSLRIGNTVQVDGKIMPIHELLNDYAVVKLNLDSPILSPAYPCISYKKISGIPLSEQELIRLGFTRLSCPEIAYRLDDLVIDIDPESFDGEPVWNFWIASGLVKRMKVLKYIHDLQNLYYSLTGTELTYKVDSGLTPTEPDTKELKQ